MGSDSTCDISDAMTKPRAAALGVRVKPAGRLRSCLRAQLGRLSSAMFGGSSCLTRSIPKRDSRITQRWENWKETPER